jgi:hypothetical protein
MKWDKKGWFPEAECQAPCQGAKPRRSNSELQSANGTDLEIFTLRLSSPDPLEIAVGQTHVQAPALCAIYAKR